MTHYIIILAVIHLKNKIFQALNKYISFSSEYYLFKTNIFIFIIINLDALTNFFSQCICMMLPIIIL